jgi:hypothetical protein
VYGELVSIHRQSLWLYGCWSLKGPFRNRPKQKQKPRTAVFTAAAQAIREKTYSRNSQSSTATLEELGDLPFGLDILGNGVDCLWRESAANTDMGKSFRDDLRRKLFFVYDQGEGTLEALACHFLVSVG